MPTRAIIKQIQQLKLKKHRDAQGLFCAEGVKSVEEGMRSGLKLAHCFVSDHSLARRFDETYLSTSELVSDAEMKKLTHFSTPSSVLAVFHKPLAQPLPNDQWIIALDGIQDPGNLGTLMRTLEWFGFKHLLCSPSTVDCFNEKVVQASMGSYARMNCVYEDLPKAIESLGLPAIGADLNGKPLEQFEFDSSGILVLGNEGHGLSSQVTSLLSERVTISKALGSSVESLNAAVSGAVIAYTISSRLGFLR